TAKVKPGSIVAVLGCGGVGQAVIQGARIAGAGRIIAIDPQELKRRTAKQLGATDTIDPSKGDPVEQVKALTGGRGADYAFEVIGLPETILTTYTLARRGGEVIIVGMARFDAQFTLPAFGIFYEEKIVKGCKYGSAQVRRDFPRFVELIETRRLDTSAMVSKTIKLESVNDAFRAMDAGDVVAHRVVPEALPEVRSQGGREARAGRQEGGLRAAEHDPGQSPEDQLVPAEATEDADLP